MAEEGDKVKEKGKQPFQLDPKALEAIIEGVMTKERKPREHSGSESA
jgi:hypothetical protein